MLIRAKRKTSTRRTPAALGGAVVVTGANRGLGLAIAQCAAARGHAVFAGHRGKTPGKALVSVCRKDPRVIPMRIDVTDAASCRRAAQRVKKSGLALRGLFNNAGVAPDLWTKSERRAGSVLSLKRRVFDRTLAVNFWGVLDCTRHFLPLLLKSKGSVINVSSGMGQLSTMQSGAPAYRLSKVCLNTATVLLSQELRGTGVTCNAVCPGWLRTRMGGAAAPVPASAGARTVVSLMDLPRSVTGQFFIDGAPAAF